MKPLINNIIQPLEITEWQNTVIKNERTIQIQYFEN